MGSTEDMRVFDQTGEAMEKLLGALSFFYIATGKLCLYSPEEKSRMKSFATTLDFLKEKLVEVNPAKRFERALEAVCTHEHLPKENA